MEQHVFSAMELDAIGEVMNISLGSSATAVSNLLDHRVDITTPSVSVVPVEEFSLGDLEPAIAVEIKYVSGLGGSNIMLLKRNDVKVIVDILMGSEIPDEEFELNELTISAVCEVMNQMMGAASTALSDFLGRSVNISTPQSFTLENLAQFKDDHFHTQDGLLVVVRFTLGIEDILQSEFVNVMSVKLARELLGGFGMGLDELSSEPIPQTKAEESHPQEAEQASTQAGGGSTLSQDEIERLMASMAAPQPEAGTTSGLQEQPAVQTPPQPMQPQPVVQPQPVQQPTMQPQPAVQPQPMQQPTMQPQPAVQPQPMQQPLSQIPVQPQPVYSYAPPVAPEPRVINAQPLPLPTLDVTKELGEERAQNLELIMSVPLEVSVEIGRTRRKVEDILTFSKGSLVVLDKLAGDQVDLFVNGLCVARGDVVVIDDNFGVRITEVLKQPGLMDLAKRP
ncbi:MAG: flagellar motor switch phosphatase FliY [Lawsonibacter sp.]|jgi:flagellar motor switch protein FliN/FliY